MAVSGINHINIRTTDVAASAKFYVDVFDLVYRGEAEGRPVNRLYDQDGHPIVHLRVMEADSPSTGPIDHVALNCRGMAQILERLKARQIEYSVFDGLRPGLTIVFIKDPHGVSLELNFADG